MPNFACNLELVDSEYLLYKCRGREIQGRRAWKFIINTMELHSLLYLSRFLPLPDVIPGHIYTGIIAIFDGCCIIFCFPYLCSDL